MHTTLSDVIYKSKIISLMYSTACAKHVKVERMGGML